MNQKGWRRHLVWAAGKEGGDRGCWDTRCPLYNSLTKSVLKSRKQKTPMWSNQHDDFALMRGITIKQKSLRRQARRTIQGCTGLRASLDPGLCFKTREVLVKGTSWSRWQTHDYVSAEESTQLSTWHGTGANSHMWNLNELSPAAGTFLSSYKDKFLRAP